MSITLVNKCAVLMLSRHSNEKQVCSHDKAFIHIASGMYQKRNIFMITKIERGISWCVSSLCLIHFGILFMMLTLQKISCLSPIANHSMSCPLYHVCHQSLTLLPSCCICFSPLMYVLLTITWIWQYLLTWQLHVA